MPRLPPEDPPDELAPRRKRGRQPKAPSPDMPAPILTPESEREALANWWRGRMDQIEAEHEERVRLLREGGEHPTPVFARQIKMMGALGMPKSLTCKVLCIPMHTLEAYYADEYQQGAAEIIAQVAANMIRIGTSMTDPANAKVGMDILSRRGGEEWRPPAQKIETTRTDTEEKKTLDTSGWSAEDRQALREMLMRNVEGAEPDDEPGTGVVPA